MDTFTEKRFNNDDAARAYLEGLRWPDGPVCPHCGVVGHAYAIKPAGTYRCAEAACRKNFTVTMNSPMERSHIALHKWVLAFHLICSSKKGMSAHQLHRTLGITYRSAWFMAHRIRECMRAGGLAAPIGGSGKTVEADETYFGTIPKAEIMPGNPNKKATGRRTGISRPAFAPWWRLWSAAVMPVHSTSRRRIRIQSARSCARTSPKKHASTPTKARSTTSFRGSFQCTKRSNTKITSMCAAT
jgi:transposase-like protein